MVPVQIRPALRTDLDCIARVGAETTVAAPYYEAAIDEGDEFHRWRPRISWYFDGSYHPRFAQADRTLIVAECALVVGFGAGHVSTRLGCTSELQWMFVLTQWQRCEEGVLRKISFYALRQPIDSVDCCVTNGH